ncbi:MAG: hypothetical protein WC614_10150 [bacterium]
MHIFSQIKRSFCRNRETVNLDRGWVIANHILVSFHVAFISSILSIASNIASRGEVLKFMFFSYETLISLLFLYITFHTGIALHEVAHYLKAVKLNALNETLLPSAQAKMEQNIFGKIFWYLEMYFKIPLGLFKGVTKTGLDYHPDAPYNLAVAAAGPIGSRNLAILSLPVAIFLLILGLTKDVRFAVYAGRLFLGLGLVGLLDFLLADPGKYKEFNEREAKAKRASAKISSTRAVKSKKWADRVKRVKDLMIYTRMEKIILPDGREKWAPWEFRNCGMGGRHTEKEFPESNISPQESMFVPLGARDYENAQEMTVNLQTRLKEIIENAEGCAVKGIGTEGGIAAYIKKEKGDTLSVQRLWRMQKQAILDCGYVPGKDVAIALDPAASELENAYKEEKGLSGEEAIGMYLDWRDKDKKILSRDELLEIYRRAMDEDELPIISIEDGFAEDDDTGWKLLMEKLGDKIHIIGDDNITTKDSSIEEKADKRLINTALIKLNQIGSVTEGVLALLTAIGKGLQTVVSHRSKSPVEDFEAHIALAAHSLGLKAGGGSNSERLFKYEAVVKVMKEAIHNISKEKGRQVITDKEAERLAEDFINKICITKIVAREASTNAGIPTVAVEIKAGIAGSEKYEKLLVFEGATPLGTSAGTDEAIHLIDKIIPASSPIVKQYPEFFLEQEDKTYLFKKGLTETDIAGKNSPELLEIWQRAIRYNGKGCLNAVDNINNIISKAFLGKKVSELPELTELDNVLLKIERETAIQRGVLAPNAPVEECIKIMQRKANLGMNSILSLSLALARLKGGIKGKELYEVVEEQMVSTMAKVFAFNGGIDLLGQLEEKIIFNKLNVLRYEKVAKRGKERIFDVGMEEVSLSSEERASTTEKITHTIERIKSAGGELWESLAKELSFEELSIGLQIVNEYRKKDIPLYKLIREQLPVYKID